MLRPALALAPFLAAALAAFAAPDPTQTPDPHPTMKLGAFSISLAVKDIAASRAFYEKLGFREAGGNQAQNWLVLRSGTTTIGLFQGMFDANILTFNPGWGAGAKPLEEFEDVRDLQRRLIELGIEPTKLADESTAGPAHFTLSDPDGNVILVDQHVPRPAAK